MSNEVPALNDYTIVKILSEDASDVSGSYIVKKPGSQILRIATLYDTREMDEESEAEIVNNAWVMASVKHPNILTFYESYIHEESEVLVVVTEYCNRYTLGLLIDEAAQEAKPRSLNFLQDNIRSFILQIAYGLKQLGEYEILHRGLTSSCILLNDMGFAKIGNFSVAKLLEEKKAGRISDFRFCSPEFFRKEPLTLKSDLWSLGIMIYEMLYFQTPFEHIPQDDIEEIAEAVRNVDIEYPEEVPLGDDYEDVVALAQSLLKGTPNKRPTIEAILMNPMFNTSKISLPDNYANTMKLWDFTPKSMMPPYDGPVDPIDFQEYNAVATEWRELRVEHLLNGRDDLKDSEHSLLLNAIFKEVVKKEPETKDQGKGKPKDSKADPQKGKEHSKNNPTASKKPPKQEEDSEEEPINAKINSKKPTSKKVPEPDYDSEDERSHSRPAPKKKPKKEDDLEIEPPRAKKSKKVHEPDDDSEEDRSRGRPAPKSSTKRRPDNHKSKPIDNSEEKIREKEKPREAMVPRTYGNLRYRQVVIPRKVDKIRGLWNDQFTEEILHFKKINYKTLVSSKMKPFKYDESKSVKRQEMEKRERDRSLLLNQSYDDSRSVLAKQPHISHSPAKGRGDDKEKKTYAEKMAEKSQKQKEKDKVDVADKLRSPNQEDSDGDRIPPKNQPGKYTADGKKLKMVDMKQYAESDALNLNDYNKKKHQKRQQQMEAERFNEDEDDRQGHKGQSPNKGNKKGKGGQVYDLDESELPVIDRKKR